MDKLQKERAKTRMLLKQFSLACLSHFSYLVADKNTGFACVIDPQRDIDIYLSEVKARGLSIKYVVLTHCHADFASGHLELARAAGATVAMGAKSAAKFPFHALSEGNLLNLGDICLKVLETPGHTPESISLLAYDNTEGIGRPEAVFTGDTLFLGDVGRPDLLGAVGINAADLASMMFDSLTKFKSLPDEIIVYPAHGAGSSCGKNLSKESSTSLKVQKLTNWALQETNKENFIAELISCQNPAPQYFSHTANYNQGEHITLEEVLEASIKPINFANLPADTQILDVRHADEFANCHIKGSINIGLAGKYANWAGTVLSPHKPIVIVAESGDESEAVMRLGRIGFDNVKGFLEDGIQTCPEANLATSQRLTVSEIRSLSKECVVLDVRTPDEFANFHIEGALHIPLVELQARISEVPKDKCIAVVCAGGYRSSIAASLLRQNSLADITDLIGGMSAYEKEIAVKS